MGPFARVMGHRGLVFLHRGALAWAVGTRLLSLLDHRRAMLGQGRAMPHHSSQNHVSLYVGSKPCNMMVRIKKIDFRDVRAASKVLVALL